MGTNSTPHADLPSPTPPLVSDETDYSNARRDYQFESYLAPNVPQQHNPTSNRRHKRLSSVSLVGSTGPDSPCALSNLTMMQNQDDEFFTFANVLSAKSLWARPSVNIQGTLPPPQILPFNEILAAVPSSDRSMPLPLAFPSPLSPPEELTRDLTEIEIIQLASESHSVDKPGKAGKLPITGIDSSHPEDSSKSGWVQSEKESSDWLLDGPAKIWVHGTPGAGSLPFIRSATQSSQSSRLSIAQSLRRRSRGKIKQGLAGFANGFRASAMADTGSRKNVISTAYAAELGLKIQGSPSPFTLGSSRQAFSIGTVSLLWSFAANPKKTISVICDVLPRCIYDLILGNGFLTATETMSKYRHRLTRCFFSMGNKLSAFAFLGEGCQRLKGTLADAHDVLAVPDTGAERNVMSLQYVIDHDLYLREGPEHRNWLQFADGSYEKTVGQVDTHWTFATGERIPVTFEILEECCSDVIIGEEICTQHNVFEDHGSSLIQLDLSSASYELAPFDFISGWQRAFGPRTRHKQAHGQVRGNNLHLKEQRRRDVWNYKYNYGASASTGEKELEMAKRSLYTCGPSGGHQMPVIPSIPTAPSAHPPPDRSDPCSEGRSTR